MMLTINDDRRCVARSFWNTVGERRLKVFSEMQMSLLRSVRGRDPFMRSLGGTFVIKPRGTSLSLQGQSALRARVSVTPATAKKDGLDSARMGCLLANSTSQIVHHAQKSPMNRSNRQQEWTEESRRVCMDERPVLRLVGRGRVDRQLVMRSASLPAWRRVQPRASCP